MDTLNNFVLGLFFLAGSIMAIDGIIIYFDWHFPLYAIIGMGFVIGSFTRKYFSSN